MPKKPSPDKPSKLRPDVAETAFRVMQEAIGEAPKTDPAKRPKNPEAAKRGKKGGKARAASLTPVERTRIAKKAATGRWAEKKD